MAGNKTGLSGVAQTFRRDLETSGPLSALPRVHGPGGNSVPGLGMNITDQGLPGKTAGQMADCWYTSSGSSSAYSSPAMTSLEDQLKIGAQFFEQRRRLRRR